MKVARYLYFINIIKINISLENLVLNVNNHVIMDDFNNNNITIIKLLSYHIQYVNKFVV